VLLLGTIGLLLLILLRTRLRLAGLVPLASIAFVAGAEKPPDLIIAQSGRAVAMRDAADNLVLLYPGRDRFVTDIWERAWPTAEPGTMSAGAAKCGRDLCAVTSPSGVRVEIVYAPQLINAACLTADVLATPRLRYVNCRGRKPEIILKRGDFEAKGTHIVRFGNPKGGADRFSIETAIAEDDRPWNLARRIARATEEARKPMLNSGVSTQPAGPVPSPGPD
jgi:competence protein ComEC